MEKTIELENSTDMKGRVDKHSRVYLYRISSVSIDKVTLEKHLSTVMNTFDGKDTLAVKINDDTKVGTVTQKMNSFIISEVSKRVDHIAIDFIMGEKDKQINKIIFEGVTSV